MNNNPTIDAKLEAYIDYIFRDIPKGEKVNALIKLVKIKAQKKYDDLLATGLSPKDAAGQVVEWLKLFSAVLASAGKSTPDGKAVNSNAARNMADMLNQNPTEYNPEPVAKPVAEPVASYAPIYEEPVQTEAEYVGEPAPLYSEASYSEPAISYETVEKINTDEPAVLEENIKPLETISGKVTIKSADKKSKKTNNDKIKASKVKKENSHKSCKKGWKIFGIIICISGIAASLYALYDLLIKDLLA